MDEYKIKSNETLSIIPFTDAHVGASTCDYEFLDYWKKVVSRIKGHKRIYCLGDMLEASSKSVANSAFKQSMDLNEQREYIIDLLYPFKDDIVIYHQGNHSFRLSKDYDYDIAKDMARELEVPYSMGGHIDKFKVNDKNYSIYTHHGKGSASRRDLAIGKIIRDTNKISANIFMVGHLHHAMVYKDYIKSSNGLEPRYYVYGGAFLNYKSSYADQMALNEVPPAFLIGNISKNHKIKWTEVDRIDWEKSTEYNGN